MQELTIKIEKVLVVRDEHHPDKVSIRVADVPSPFVVEPEDGFYLDFSCRQNDAERFLREELGIVDNIEIIEIPKTKFSFSKKRD